MPEGDKSSTGELERRTIGLLRRRHSYHVDDTDRIWKGGYLGYVKIDGTVQIRYSLNLKNIEEQLKLRDFLEEHDVGYQEEGLREIKEDLTKKCNHLTDMLKKLDNVS